MTEPTLQSGQATAGRGSWQTPAAAAVVLLAVGVAAYYNSFSGAFLFDDRGAILEKRVLWERGSLWQIVSQQGQTPVLAVTLAINYILNGPYVWGYHFVNLAIHLSAALVLFGIVRRTLLTERLRRRLGPASLPLALSVALVWMVHPLQTEAVTYIIQRKESLMGLFYLLTVYCTIRGHDSPRRRWWLLGAVAACALGIGTKQVMVTAPVAVLLYDRTFLSGSFRRALARSWYLYLLLAGTWLMLLTSLQRLQQEGLGVEGTQASLGTLDYARTQFGVILHYLYLTFWPVRLCLDYFDWPVVRTFSQCLLPGAIVLAMAGATVAALWRAPAAGFPAAWFFLVLAPTSSIVVVTELAVEHRMYLPLAGVAALVVVGGHAAGRHLQDRLGLGGGWRRLLALAGLALVLAVVALLGWRTYQRNRDYRSEYGMASSAVSVRPNNPRPHVGVGIWLLRAGNLPGALAEFQTCVRLKGDYALAYNNLGLTYQRLGVQDQERGDQAAAIRNFDRALENYARAIQLLPSYTGAHVNRGNLYKLTRQYHEAMAEYNRAIELTPQSVEAHSNLGSVYQLLGEYERAVKEYSTVLALDDEYVSAWSRRGSAYGQMGEYDKAIADCTRAVELDPDYAEAHYNLAVAYYHKNEIYRALAKLRTCDDLGYPVPPPFRRAVMGRLPAGSVPSPSRIPGAPPGP